MSRKQKWWIAGSLVAVLIAAILLSIWIVRARTQRRAGSAGVPSEADALRLLNQGKDDLEHLRFAQAIKAFQRAAQLRPSDIEPWRDLAAANLRAGQSEKAIDAAQHALELDRTNAAALYLIGCARLRLGQFESAVKALQQCEQIDSQIAAVHFQLGLAQQGMGHLEAAAGEMRAAIALDPEHPSAHYVLSQLLVQAGDASSARIELAHHQEIQGRQPNRENDPYWLERCAYTKAVVPFALTEQPEPSGVPVRFVDATTSMLPNADRYRAPAGVIDLQHAGHDSLLVQETPGGFRLLKNNGHGFVPEGAAMAAGEGGKFKQCLIGDLQNDGTDDAVIIGDTRSLAFTFNADGQASDVSASSGIAKIQGKKGVLADLDFTGKLGLLVVPDDGVGLRAYRNQGNLTFTDVSEHAVVSKNIAGVRSVAIADWNRDDLPDVLVSRDNASPLLLPNQRGGPLVAAKEDAAWPKGSVLAVGDLDNDGHPDMVVASGGVIQVMLSGRAPRTVASISDITVSSLVLADYDNDGWLDIIAAGDNGILLFRNIGGGNFRDVTHEVGLDMVPYHRVQAIHAADLDGDGNLDLLLELQDGHLQILRNDGGNANHSISIHLSGTRSNASGLGSGLELVSGGWRTYRQYDANPMLIGIGRHTSLDRATVHWYDLAVTTANIAASGATPVTLTEPQLPAGSCPNLYAWDGNVFRYVCDILGSSPAGLPVAEGHLIDADTNELVWVGGEKMFPPKDGRFLVSITDELREVLYLDKAKLVAVDHAPGTEVHSLDKLVPRKPFPKKGIVTLGNRRPLISATRSDGKDVTAALMDIDGAMASPVKLRPPQLRGLAEPWAITLDFGPLDADRPLVLALSGWLRFGGGMANIAAAQNPDLPFPFPKLDAETADGWKPVDVVVGAPAGKTKTIVVDLAGKLPAGSRRLRLSCAFEIHWDRIALFEGMDPRQSQTIVTRLSPSSADLRWHGFGIYEDRPWDQPLTPIYERVTQTPPWTLTPSGWCTRYGDVLELLENTNDHLAILNAGDEVLLSFDAGRLPAKAPDHMRDFFLYTDGWDKDADYHVIAGDSIEPIPFHGMDDQRYEALMPRSHNAWEARFNTRWVGPSTLNRTARSH